MKKVLSLFLTVLALLTVILSGCGSAKSTEYEVNDAYYEASSAKGNGMAEYAYDDEEFYSEEMVSMETASETPMETTVHSQNASEKLVYTCNIYMQTIEFEKTVNALKALIEQYDGFIEAETTTDSADYWYYENYRKTQGTLLESITVRIPTEHYNDFLSDIEGEGKIIKKSQNVENITKNYYSVVTTIESLETQEQRLLEMMENAETIEEMLQIEDRLTEVQDELAHYKNNLSEMDTDVDFSTIDMTIEEVLEYEEVEDPEYTNTFGDRLKNTLKNSWEGFLDFLEGLLFFLIEALPILLVLGLIGFGIYLIIAKIVRRKRAKKAKVESKNTAAETKVETPTNNN